MEEREDGLFISTVKVTLAATSKVVEGKGHPDRNKAGARESAAKVMCSKIKAIAEGMVMLFFIYLTTKV